MRCWFLKRVGNSFMFYFVFVIMLCLIIAWIHSFIALPLFPFCFTPQILTFQPFLLSIQKNYFLIIGLFLCVGTASIYLIPQHKKNILCLLALCCLSFFSPLLCLYFVTTTILMYFINLKPFQKNPIMKYAGLWILIGLVMPWLGVCLNRNWDSLRVIFFSICGMRIGMFMYDIHFRKCYFSFQDTVIYFLCPVHFFIPPSWIACPFSSDLKEIGIERETLKRGAKKIARGCLYLLTSLLIGVLFYMAKGYYLTDTIIVQHQNPFFFRIGFTMLLCFSKILYLFFIADALTGLYILFGYEMKIPIFNKPFLAENIFDFWNRFLAQTKEFIMRLFFQPTFDFLKKHTRMPKLSFILTIAGVFFFIDILLHIGGVFDVNKAFVFNGFIFRWYFSLMGCFAFYAFWIKLIPVKIQSYGNYPLGQFIKTLFWVCIIGYFY